MELTYHGHASFPLKTAGGTALIDPWFTGNTLADRLWSEAEADWIFLTHAHFDHMGDALAIARARGAVIVAVSELAKYCAAQGGVETLKGKKLAMTWAYSPSYGKPLSCPQSLISLLPRFGG